MHDPVSYTHLDVYKRQPSAQLTQSLARLSTRPAIQQLALEELEAAGYRDGVDVEHEELREIVCDKRAPETPEERLFANARELIEEIEELASEPFNVELIAYMHERLALDTKGLRVEPRPSPAPKTSVPSPPSDQLLESIVAGCENPCLWGPHPLFGALINADTIWVTPAFERFNGLMELLIRWRSYYAIGVPALRFVPLSKMRLDWERRLVGPPDAPMRYGEALVVSSFGVDSTDVYKRQIFFMFAPFLVEAHVGRVRALAVSRHVEALRFLGLAHAPVSYTHLVSACVARCPCSSCCSWPRPSSPR